MNGEDKLEVGGGKNETFGVAQCKTASNSNNLGGYKNSGQSNAAGLVVSHKPISTSSPEALAAAQQVTPNKLAQLLLSKGPLAIRFITQALTEEIPSFKDLSASKQRRLIMSALETGEQENSVVFAKIGWGQWSARYVKPDLFIKERELTNLANSKVKDTASQESLRRSSGGNAKKTVKSGSFLKEIKRPLANAATGIYIDENALSSEEEEDIEDAEPLTYDAFKRRQSSVVTIESPLENNEPNHNLLKSIVSKPSTNSTSNNRRRSTSKIRSLVTKPGNPKISAVPAEFIDSGFKRLSSPMNDHYSDTKTDHTTRDELPSDELLGGVNNSTKASIKRSAGVGRCDFRLSFGRESSIRSTLLMHSNYNIVLPPLHPKFMPPHTNAPAPAYSTYDKNNQPPQNLELPSTTRREDHSDTDEEDWASIGAPALRNNSLPSNIFSPHLLHASSPSVSISKTQSAHTSPRSGPYNNMHLSTLASQLSLPLHQHSRHSAQHQAQQKQQSWDTEDAALLLMSLKS